MLHHTVASVALYSMGTNKIYYFQFVCDGIDLPLDMKVDSNMAISKNKYHFRGDIKWENI